MADYFCVIRTNYFHVKDEEAFRLMMFNVHDGYGNKVELYENKDKNGETEFSFGGYDGISFRDYSNGIVEEDLYDDFINRLQKFVAENDAIIILEVGHMKLSYLCGIATIVTSTGVEHADITESAFEQATKMLNNPLWQAKY